MWMSYKQSSTVYRISPLEDKIFSPTVSVIERFYCMWFSRWKWKFSVFSGLGITKLRLFLHYGQMKYPWTRRLLRFEYIGVGKNPNNTEPEVTKVLRNLKIDERTRRGTTLPWGGVWTRPPIDQVSFLWNPYRVKNTEANDSFNLSSPSRAPIRRITGFSLRSFYESLSRYICSARFSFKFTDARKSYHQFHWNVRTRTKDKKNFLLYIRKMRAHYFEWKLDIRGA